MFFLRFFKIYFWEREAERETETERTYTLKTKGRGTQTGGSKERGTSGERDKWLPGALWSWIPQPSVPQSRVEHLPY